MEIYLVPFSLLDLVCLSPLYAYALWYAFRKLFKQRAKFAGFMSWSFIVHAAVIPIFWVLHFCGIFQLLEAENTSFDPVQITGHVGAFFAVYFLFVGGITLLLLSLIKKNSY